jgi:hypothetical protein
VLLEILTSLRYPHTRRVVEIVLPLGVTTENQLGYSTRVPYRGSVNSLQPPDPSVIFALSAARGGKIYYTRCNFSEGRAGTIHCVYLGYPESKKRRWDGIVTHVSYSLRP